MHSTSPRDTKTPPAATAASADPGRVTPMMAQYVEIKTANPDSLLFYRMGDFYELFFQDAEIASRTLGIVLTKRGKHLGEDIAMCGVPVEHADDYLQKLIAAGHRVAVCEQTEDPAEAKKRGAKSVVKRDVVRLVTPGTLTEDRLLDPARANLLLAIGRRKVSEGRDAYGLAAIDISTGRFAVLETHQRGLSVELARLEPREIVCPDAIHDDPELKEFWRDVAAPVTPLAREGLDPASGERRLKEFFGVATLDAFGAFSRAEIAAAAISAREKMPKASSVPTPKNSFSRRSAEAASSPSRGRGVTGTLISRQNSFSAGSSWIASGQTISRGSRRANSIARRSCGASETEKRPVEMSIAANP